MSHRECLVILLIRELVPPAVIIFAPGLVRIHTYAWGHSTSTCSIQSFPASSFIRVHRGPSGSNNCPNILSAIRDRPLPFSKGLPGDHGHAPVRQGPALQALRITVIFSYADIEENVHAAAAIVYYGLHLMSSQEHARVVILQTW